jgi:hypothetical protein
LLRASNLCTKARRIPPVRTEKLSSVPGEIHASRILEYSTWLKCCADDSAIKSPQVQIRIASRRRFDQRCIDEYLLISRFSSYPASVIQKYSPRSVSSPRLIYLTSARMCKNIFSPLFPLVHPLFFSPLRCLPTLTITSRAQRSREVQHPGAYGR